MWMALGGIYFVGGHTALNGSRSDNEQANTRAWLHPCGAVERNNSLKLSASTGIATRTGCQFVPLVLLGSTVGAKDFEQAMMAI
jgi:hypothetical protein